MLTLDKPKMILWEAESTTDNVIVLLDKDTISKIIEKHMQDEPYYGDPDYSYY